MASLNNLLNIPDASRINKKGSSLEDYTLPLSAYQGYDTRSRLGASVGRALGGVVEEKVSQMEQNALRKKRLQQMQDSAGALRGIIPEEQIPAFLQLAYEQPALAKVILDNTLKQMGSPDYNSMLLTQEGEDVEQMQPPEIMQQETPPQELSVEGQQPELMTQQPVAGQEAQDTGEQYLKKQKDLETSLGRAASSMYPLIPRPKFTNNAMKDKELMKQYNQEVNNRSNRIEEYKKRTLKDLQSSDKDLRKRVNELTKVEKARIESDFRLDRIESLTRDPNVDEGNKAWNVFVDFAKNKGLFGIKVDLTGTMTEAAQEINKLSNDFMRSAQEIYGNRLTEMAIRNFLTMIPTLMQSKEGRLRVIHNMRLFNEGSKLRFNVMQDIIKENFGYAPRDLEFLIEKRVGPELDKLGQRFVFEERVPLKEGSKSSGTKTKRSNIITRTLPNGSVVKIDTNTGKIVSE